MITETEVNPLTQTPELLKSLNQWVTWKYEQSDGRATKVPFNPETGRQAKANTPQTWTNFLRAAIAPGYEGPGFVFSADDKFTGIDLDGCRNPETGEIAAWAMPIIQSLDSYTEVSPSGTGVKIWIIAKSPLSTGKKKSLRDAPRIADKEPAIEVYDHDRYFAVTGLRLDGCPAEPQERQVQLDELCHHHWRIDEQAPNARASQRRTATAIVERARKYIATMPPAIDGQKGHDQTYAVACRLCIDFALSRDDALELLREYNTRCVPPWSDAELERKIDQAMKAEGERGSLLVSNKGKANKAKRGRKTAAASSEADAIVADVLTPIISNTIEIDEKSQEPKTMGAILEDISETTDGWPCRVGATLFVDDPQHGLSYLERIDSLFGWLSSKARIDWARLTGCVSRGEVFAELKRTARPYRAVEAYPHFPPFADHYYAHAPIELGGGEYLRGLLDYFCPETPIDRDLILGAFASAVWGGEGGTRPAFVFTSKRGRGMGKTALMEAIGLLNGGMFAINKDDRAADIDRRLLTPSAATKRIVGIDNIKTGRLSWGDLEARITARCISGHQMYAGEHTRPNTLLWCVTLNGPSLSRDMAQRCVIVNLDRPKHSGDWADSLREYIETHRWKIFADLAAFFSQEPAPLTRHTRWGVWEREVLARLPEPSDAQRVIEERQGEVDADSEESADIEDHFRQELARLGYKPHESVHIPNNVAREWYTRATGHRASTTGVTRAIKQAADEGVGKRLKVNLSRTYGRGLLWAASAGSCAIAYDLVERITKAQRQQDAKQDA